MDEGERGDDEDDAGRCRSDARGQPSTAFVAAERVGLGGTVDSDGADIARAREKKFSESSAFVATRNRSRLLYLVRIAQLRCPMARGCQQGQGP